MQSYGMVLTILLMNLFIAFLGIGLVVPVTPTIMNELNINGAIVGYMVAAFAVTQLIASPPAGKLVDHWGRKPMIVAGLILFSLSELLFAVGQSVDMLMISRMIGGISAAFIMPAVTAYIADITSVETRPKALGYMSAAISTGFIIGPGIGGFLAEISTRLPFCFAAGFAGFAAILSFFTLREPERNPENKEPEKTNAGIKRIFVPLFFIPFMIVFISTFGLAAFESLFALFADHKFGFTAIDIAVMITGGAIVGALAQILLFDRLIKWVGEIKLIQYSLIFSTILLVLLTFVSGYYTILLITAFMFVGFDLMRPAVTTYLSNIAGREQGFVGGMNSMFTSIGNVIGPVIGGILFDIELNYPFYFAASFLCAGVALTFVWKKPDLGRNPVSKGL